MKKILILVFSNLRHDARIVRQINFLKNKYAVTVCCYHADPSSEYRVITFSNRMNFIRKAISGVLLLLKRFSLSHSILYPYKKYLSHQLQGETFDLIIANDVETLPLAFQLKSRDTKIIFDAHEYAPLHFEDKFWWRVFFQDFNTFMCKTYIPRVHAMLTIAQSLADEYERNFSVKPLVITNAGPYYDLKPKETSALTIKLVHHGIVNRSRRIELIIGMMRHLPEYFTLDLVLVVTTQASQQTVNYLQELKAMAASDKRIRFVDPVPIHKIIPLLQDYDMGIILAPPINFNYSNGLPNKLFDYIQARISVLTGPTPEIAKIVNKYFVGIVADNFTPEGMTKKLASVDRAKIQQFKHQSDVAAKEFNAEKNEVIFNALVSSLLGT
jgi:hypothetical protein